MMKKMRKILAFAFMCAMLVSTVTVGATETELLETEVATSVESYVYDYAGLLTSNDIASLDKQIADMMEKTGWDIFAVTTNYAEGKSSMAYADDFYDEHTAEDSDGILVLIDMDNREIYISTCGKAIRYLTDERIEYVLDEGFYYVSEGDYAACLRAMLTCSEQYYDRGIPQNQYNYDVETGAVSRYHSLTMMEVGSVLLLAVVVGLVIYFSVVRSYHMKGGRYDYPYMKYGKVDLIDYDDHFIRQNVTHHRIQRDHGGGGGGHHSGGGGRSSTHHSSSGRSHGGGGRKF